MPLIIAISLPIVFIVILALTVFVPAASINPQYDFIYTTEQDRYSYAKETVYENRYQVTDGKLTQVSVNLNRSEDERVLARTEFREAPTLYRYDVKEDSSKEITFEEAQALDIDRGPSSPEGYTVKYEYNSDGIFELFGSNRGSGFYMVKGSGKKQLPGLVGDRYYGDQINVIGWIK